MAQPSPRYLIGALLYLAAIASARAAAEELQRVDVDRGAGTAGAVVVRNAVSLVHTSQLLAWDDAGRVGGAAAEQWARVAAHLQSVLKTADSDLSRVARVHVYVADETAVVTIRAALSKSFPPDAPPAATFVVTPLPDPAALVAVDVVAMSRRGLKDRALERVSVPGLPRDRTHAVVFPADSVVFISGQAEPGTLAEATRKTMQSLHETLRHLGLDASHVVQLKSFLKPMADAATVDREIAALYKGRPLPAVSHVEWTYGTPIEIELIAIGRRSEPRPDDPVRYLAPPHLKHSPIFSRIAAVEGDALIFTSGLSGNPQTGGEGQVRDTFARLKGLLDKSGSDFRHMVKATYYVGDDEPGRALNAVRPELYDPERPPAASKAGVKSVAVPGCGLVIDMIAAPRRRD